MANSLGNKEKMAANIRRYLEKFGITQTDLAAELGVPATTVYNWCQGATYPRIDKIEMMANFFGCSSLIRRKNMTRNMTRGWDPLELQAWPGVRSP